MKHNTRNNSCMFYYLAIIILISVLVSVNSRGCGLEFLKNTKSQLIKPIGDEGRYLKEDEFEPLRIHLDYSLIENNMHLYNKEDLKSLKEHIMPKTKEVYEKILKVKRLKSKLKFDTDYCDHFKLPNDYTSHGKGINADLVIFVTLDNSGFFEQNGIEAAAIHCLQHAVNRRPLAGYIQFQQNLKVDDSTAKDYLIWLALHEVSHILVMNDSLYGDYVNQDHNLLGLKNTILYDELNSNKIKYIKSPKVLEKAKKHFGCDSILGVPLEYHGGVGTIGAHWSKKIMNTDYMIGDSYAENLISEITLALFEDSGWYQPDYEASNLFLWGQGKGCNFFNGRCVEEKSTRIISNFMPEFCASDNKAVCSMHNIFRGVCAIKKYRSPLPNHQRYFTDAFRGGVDDLTDKCPICVEKRGNQNYYGGSCRVGEKRKSIEEICPECACFMSSLEKMPERKLLRVTSSHPSLESKFEDHDASCFNFKCEKAELHVIIEGNDFPCKEKGQEIHINGYKGSLICPDPKVLCHKKFKCKFGCTEEYTNKTKYYKIK